MTALFKDAPTGEQYLRMGDVELARKLDATIGEIDDDDLSDRLYWLTSEMLERWAPDVEWASIEIQYAHNTNRENELRDHAEAVAKRREARAIYQAANEQAAAIRTGFSTERPDA